MDNQLIYSEIYREPKWHKWIDALVILFIGAICGIVFTQGMKFYDVQTTTSTEVQYQLETPGQNQEENTGKVSAPQKSLKIEEV